MSILVSLPFRLFYDVSCSDWDRIKSPTEDKIVPYSKLPEGENRNLNKLAVLKVNGGLGTSMGMSSFDHLLQSS